jgi:hypothetical protein
VNIFIKSSQHHSLYTCRCGDAAPHDTLPCRRRLGLPCFSKPSATSSTISPPRSFGWLPYHAASSLKLTQAVPTNTAGSGTFFPSFSLRFLISSFRLRTEFEYLKTAPASWSHYALASVRRFGHPATGAAYFA